MIPLVKLREMPLFAALSEERMRWVCSQLEEVKLAPGEVLVAEGQPSRGFFILLEGEIQATKLSDGVPVPAGHHTAPAFFGEVPLLAQVPLPVTVLSVGPSRLARLDDSAFRTLIAESQEFAKVIFQTMASRMSGMESFVRQREKLAALGKLAAGLAHELNNPAAAISRVVDRLRHVLEALYEATEALQRSPLQEQSCGLLEGLREAAEQRMREAGPVDPLAASSREEEVEDWLSIARGGVRDGCMPRRSPPARSRRPSWRLCAKGLETKTSLRRSRGLRRASSSRSSSTTRGADRHASRSW